MISHVYDEWNQGHCAVILQLWIHFPNEQSFVIYYFCNEYTLTIATQSDDNNQLYCYDVAT